MQKNDIDNWNETKKAIVKLIEFDKLEKLKFWTLTQFSGVLILNFLLLLQAISSCGIQAICVLDAHWGKAKEL